MKKLLILASLVGTLFLASQSVLAAEDDAQPPPAPTEQPPVQVEPTEQIPSDQPPPYVQPQEQPPSDTPPPLPGEEP